MWAPTSAICRRRSPGRITPVSHTAPSAANLQQSRVSGFNLFNLFFKYDVPGDSAIAKDLAFTLNVDNLFDTDPPFYRGLSNSLYGAANGFTLGRIVKFGVSKKF